MMCEVRLQPVPIPGVPLARRTKGENRIDWSVGLRAQSDLDPDSVGVFGRNFGDVPAPAWKGEVADAGHWSFSDICGVYEQFSACCGAGERQTDRTAFDYLPINDGIAVAQAYVTAFFSARLRNDAVARRYLEEPRPENLVTLLEHP